MMRLVETDADGVTVVEAHGRLDSTTSKAFGDRLTSLRKPAMAYSWSI